MIDLNPKHFETVQHILAKHVPGCEVRAFGSRVKWTAKDYSDLDLAIVGSKPLTLRQTGQLAEAFEESNLPMRVDVLDWHTISEEFKEIITEEYEVIQGSEVVTANEEFRIIPMNSTTKNNRWNIVELGDVVQINPRRTLTKKEKAFHLAMKDVEVYKREIISHSSREFSGSGTRFQNGDTLLARITPCLENGKTVYVDCLKSNQVGHGSTEFIVLSGIEGKTENLFVYYLARDPSFRTFAIHSMQGSTGRQRVDANTLRLYEFPLPPIEEQHGIAHILSTLDDKIELNRQMNKTLEATARAIFKSWFVDFDPVKDKIKGRKPACMDAETAALFPSAFQDSSLGKIPDGWEVGTLGDLSHQPQYGYTASAKDEIVGPKFLRITDINKQAWVDWSSVPYCEVTDKDVDKYRLYKGDVLIARMADPGHGVVIEENQEAVFASYLIRFRPIQDQYARFLQYWLRSNSYWELVKGRELGTTRASLNAKTLSGFPLVIPPLEIVEVFSSQISNLRDRIVANTSETESLSSLRDTLLPKLLSGEIRVNDTNEILEERDGRQS
ncbi:restriction endonuclease subunit S [Candidatus Poribacteria bacterium]|nr:MAG: restriction endonuclease subunit S [Candidatus Poribacteria bacterium]